MDSKAEAGEAAAKLAKAGTVVGLGTGSTAKFFIEALARREKEEKLALTCVATSNASEALAKSLGLKVVPFSFVEKIDFAADGADKIDAKLNLIKGMGGALVREKIIDYRAEKFVVIADEGKVVKELFGIVPVEVIPMAAKIVCRELKEIGAVDAVVRADGGKTFVTDNSNWIVHATFGKIKSPKKLEQEINGIAGVVDNGIFTRNVQCAIVGTGNGAREIKAGGE
ncbi:Ribose-5-phosphate isomerase A [Candidatus Anstonella stagnisolia]|nr:Ribose-5-phosphate isomerase A [Candidatus Anstonella stagnisolia]